MTQYSLFPSHVQIRYHNDRAPHVMTIPTTQWLESPNVGGAGAYSQWDSGTIDALAMITDFVELLGAIFPVETTFDDFTIYNWPTEDGPPQPVTGFTLGISGETGGSYVPATQSTWSFRTTGFHPFKLVLLDVEAPSAFTPQRQTDFSADQLAVITFLASQDHAFAGRDGNRPAQFIQATYTLNEKLRKAYRLT